MTHTSAHVSCTNCVVRLPRWDMISTGLEDQGVGTNICSIHPRLFPSPSSPASSSCYQDSMETRIELCPSGRLAAAAKHGPVLLLPVFGDRTVRTMVHRPWLREAAPPAHVGSKDPRDALMVDTRPNVVGGPYLKPDTLMYKRKEYWHRCRHLGIAMPSTSDVACVGSTQVPGEIYIG